MQRVKSTAAMGHEASSFIPVCIGLRKIIWTSFEQQQKKDLAQKLLFTLQFDSSLTGSAYENRKGGLFPFFEQVDA